MESLFKTNCFSMFKTKIDLFLPLEKPQERNTRAPLYSMEDAYKASQNYIKLLWAAIRKRVALQIPHVLILKLLLNLYSVPMPESLKGESLLLLQMLWH